MKRYMSYRMAKPDDLFESGLGGQNLTSHPIIKMATTYISLHTVFHFRHILFLQDHTGL